jgi:hypothetical protein
LHIVSSVDVERCCAEFNSRHVRPIPEPGRGTGIPRKIHEVFGMLARKYGRHSYDSIVSRRHDTPIAAESSDQPR